MLSRRSHTEWSLGAHGTFWPQLFVDVTETMDRKIEALGCYETEMRAFPHARSCDAVSALAKLRGSQSGLEGAEAFMIRREIRR